MEDVFSGERLRSMREYAGMPQSELAGLAGVSQAHIAKIEGGKVDPRMSTVNRILAVLARKEGSRSCGEVMSRSIVKAKPSDPVEGAIGMMKRFGISQLPVFEGGKNVGSISEGTVVKNFSRNLEELSVGDLMEEGFPVVDSRDPMEMLPPLLEFHPAVLVSEKGRIRGIITKSNLLGTGKAF